MSTVEHSAPGRNPMAGAVLTIAAALGGCGAEADPTPHPAADAADAAALAHSVPSDAAPADSGVVVMPLVLHVGLSDLTMDELTRVVRGINEIWRSQADICFEVLVTEGSVADRQAFHMFFTAGAIPGNEEANGVHRDPTDMWTIDAPALDPAPTPYPITTSRTAAHELGHALGLGHQDCDDACPCAGSLGIDCDEFLMRSGTLGYFLSGGEIDVARRTAIAYALSRGTTCGIIERR